MSNKAELLEQAKSEGLAVNTKTTVRELESMLGLNKSETPTTETQPETQEKSTLTQSGDSNENGETSVETLQTTDNSIATAADEARTAEEVKFADESNPNQKARDGGAPDEEYDQDGLPRTGGYSYGVAADDLANTIPNEENKGTAPEDTVDENTRVYSEPTTEPFLNTDTNSQEWDVEKQRKLEKSLSDYESGVSARVTTSAGNYVRIKFFYNNKPLATYKSRNFNEGDARNFLDRIKKNEGVK